MTSGEGVNRVWLITGASSGFGRAMAEAALAGGDTVVAAVRRPAALDYLLAAYPDQASTIEWDVTDTARATDVVNQAVFLHERIDVLVNNAGRYLVGAVEETTEAELRELMDLQFFGPAALIRAVLPHMRARRSGAIVQISSMGGRTTFAGTGAYSATKFALEGLSEALAQEVAPFGIKVLIVEPGTFRTRAIAALRQTAAHPAYADIVGPFRQAVPTMDGRQPGDPAKAAAAIITALDSDKPPLRLLLGNDAADQVSQYHTNSLAEILAWEHLTRATDYDL
jgi:NAD(P)-dependent dehydrogenase (short-subunit alcohol dehydrogenase family)